MPFVIHIFQNELDFVYKSGGFFFFFAGCPGKRGAEYFRECSFLHSALTLETQETLSVSELGIWWCVCACVRLLLCLPLSNCTFIRERVTKVTSKLYVSPSAISFKNPILCVTLL